MPKILNLTGQRFGRLIAIRHIGYISSGNKTWECLCDCGARITIASGRLQTGNTQSCGCQRLEKARTHGEASPRTREYRCWKDMLARCKPNHRAFKYYAARGIHVCERWKIYENFLTDILAEIGRCPPGMSIDRINNDGNYEPGNVRWATPSQQSRNRRGWAKAK